VNQQQIEEWASAYIAYQEDHENHRDDHPLFWATSWFMLISDDEPGPEECWRAILEVLSRNPSEHVLGMLAAGALEDLIERAGPTFIDRIEQQTRRDPAFRHLLGGVWESSTPEVWARVEAARGEPW
jgi:hypothetical protein